MGINEHYYAAIESFLACAGKLGGSELYRTDAVQYAALYLASKADMLLEAANWADLYGDREAAYEYALRIERLLLDADRLLESHPLLRARPLERHGPQGRIHGGGERTVRRRVAPSGLGLGRTVAERLFGPRVVGSHPRLLRAPAA